MMPIGEPDRVTFLIKRLDIAMEEIELLKKRAEITERFLKESVEILGSIAPRKLK